MITVSTNLSQALEKVTTQIKSIDYEKMTREQASTILAMMRLRIHEQGKATDGSPIGTYSEGYLILRSGAFQNADRAVKGKNKGSLKNAGTYTDKAIRLNKQTGVYKGDEKVGKKRIMYNRGTDPKVILSLTRQMESDYVIVPVQNGFGIGFSNAENFKKSQWNERRYKKPIFNLSKEEREECYAIANRYVEEALK